ncbi:Multidrug efflux system ATP-binding protein [Anaerolineae bacterium]|nr:Multidrug efflux system ATP-binding protein [Anaerolineae bacterium]
MACIEARGLRKRFRDRVALDGVDLSIGEGRVLGVIGPNGAGKSTLLQALLGLVPVEGELRVLGLDPWHARARLMRNVSFVTDVSSMPRWIRVAQAVDYMAAVQPAFERAKADAFLARNGLRGGDRIESLSKGLVAQLQLALAMSVDARLTVLDEPTLGLDVLARKRFFDALLARAEEESRTLVIATHELDEVQHILTHVVVLQEGRPILSCSMDDLQARFIEVAVHPDHLDVARTMDPLHERPTLGGSTLLFDGGDVDRINLLGTLRTPSLATVCTVLLELEQPAGQVA